METINSRIAKIIDEECNGNRSKFARAVNITPAFAAQIYANERIPSDRTISDICRVFNIREDWLRNGTEPMRLPKTDDDVEFINELLAASENPFMDLIRSVMKVYMELSPEDKKKAEDFVHSLKEKVKESQN